MTQARDENWISVNTDYLSAVAQWIEASLELLIHEREEKAQAEVTPAPSALVPQVASKHGFWAWLFGETVPAEMLPPPPAPTQCEPSKQKPDWKERQAETQEEIDRFAGRTNELDINQLPSFARLKWLLGLTQFEENVLRLCLATELKHSIDSLCARAQADSRRPYPTLNLALQLFQPQHEDYAALSATGALRYWSLVEVIQPSGTRLFDAALRLDSRIFVYCLQPNSLDDWLLTFGKLVLPDAVTAEAELSNAHQEVVHDLLKVWSSRSGLRPNITLAGPDSQSKLAIFVHAARYLHRHVFRIASDQLPTTPGEVDQLARNWLREQMLQPLCLYLESTDEDNVNPLKESDNQNQTNDRNQQSSLRRFLNRVASGVAISTLDTFHRAGAITLEVQRPSTSEQADLWMALLKFSDEQYGGRLSTQFNLEESALRSVAVQILTAESRGQDSEELQKQRFEQAWDLCRLRTRPRVDGLAHRIEPQSEEVALVLSEDARNQLDELEAQVRNRWRVYDDWGLRERLNRGLGIAAMFVGESGTGKTSAASEIASHLKLDLYRIDLSAVINKYIGETEKNLRRLFDAFEDCGAVLLFDECDAIFGKRTEVKDSHDRYANIEVSYLLQRIESYRGLAILATNKGGAIDSAFLRRLRFVINFPLPKPVQREEIWRRLLPPSGHPPTEALNYAWLAAFDKLTGGTIHAASMHAAFLAAQRSRNAVAMEDVRDAIKAEYLKLNLPLRNAELQLPPAQASVAAAAVTSVRNDLPILKSTAGHDA